jgi:hypothetical protein
MSLMSRHIPINWSFPDRSKWTHSTSYMIFTMIPLKTSAIDATAQ